jgi:hypothetical protein
MMDDPNKTAGSLVLIPKEKVTGLMTPVASTSDWETNWRTYQEAKAKIATDDDKLEIETGRAGADGKPEKRIFLKKSYWRKIKDFFGLQVYMISERELSVPCDPDRCPPGCKGDHYEVQAIYRAVHSNGSFTDGDGSSVDNEKWGRSKPASDKQLAAIVKQFRDRNADPEAYDRQIESITGGRTGSYKEMSSAEASAFMDYLFGKNPLCTPPRPMRNSRHNVRSGAHTRAYNRAVSNLVGGGEVSADELNEGDVEEQRRGARDPQHDVVDAEYTERPAQPAPAAKGRPAAKAPPLVAATWDAIRSVGLEIKVSAEQMALYIRDVTNKRTVKPGEMTEAEGQKLLENLKALKLEISRGTQATAPASSTPSTDLSTDGDGEPQQERLVS